MTEQIAENANCSDAPQIARELFRRSPECQAMYDLCHRCGGTGDIVRVDGEWIAAYMDALDRTYQQ